MDNTFPACNYHKLVAHEKLVFLVPCYPTLNMAEYDLNVCC